MSKQRLYLFGFITLLIFPLPTLVFFVYFKEIPLVDLLQLDKIFSIQTGLGLEAGIIYAFLALLLLQAPIFQKIPNPIEGILKEMNLNWGDIIFLSLCAGIGEELLFRTGVQSFLGIWPSSLLFVAIHGYFKPKDWKKSLYGVVVLPFVLLLGYGYSSFGLWFSIAAHFAYDLVLFAALKGETSATIKTND